MRPHSPVLGAAKARVTVVEVLDPACEACRAFAPVVEQLLFLYPEDVRVVVRFADFHPPSDEAIRLLVAARRQGKFHELLDALFQRQQEWASHSAPDPARVWKIAGEVGVDVARARKMRGHGASTTLLRLEAEDLAALKVERTPTFFVNGKLLVSFGPEQLFELVKNEVGAARPSDAGYSWNTGPSPWMRNHLVMMILWPRITGSPQCMVYSLGEPSALRLFQSSAMPALGATA